MSQISVKNFVSGLQARMGPQKSPPSEKKVQASYSFADPPVSKIFRDEAFRLLPGLAHDEPFRHLTAYLLLGTLTDQQSGALRLPRSLLATFEGRPLNGRYSSGRFLSRIRDAYLPDFDWTDHRYNPEGPGRERHLVSAGLPPALLTLLQSETVLPLDQRGPLVHFGSGKAYYLSGERTLLRKQQKEEAEIGIDLAHPGAELIAHLNALPANPFGAALKRYGSRVRALIPSLPPGSRDSAIRTMEAIDRQPQPFYGPSGRGRTVRIFTTGPSMLTLPSTLRSVLTQDWYWYDLQAAQFAIAEALWGMKTDLLSDDPNAQSIWEQLFAHFGTAGTVAYANAEARRAVKDAFKQGIYRVLFMGSRELAIRHSDEHGAIPQFLSMNSEDGMRRLFSHPGLQSLYNARRAESKRVQKAQGTYDVFGRWIEAHNAEERRSAMAQRSQSAELDLLLPVLHLARTTDDFAIVAWLHDGLAIKYSDRTKQARWEARILKAAETKAAERGIRTRLVAA